MIMNEISNLQHLDHPNILKMYEYFEDQKRLYIVTDLYKGGELFHEVKVRGRLGEKDVATLIRQLLSCVSYCHSKGIVHRDLNPQNILLADSGKQKSFESIKIIDFGCSVNCDAKQQFAEMIGTPYYIAPEILRGKGC